MWDLMCATLTMLYWMERSDLANSDGGGGELADSRIVLSRGTVDDHENKSLGLSRPIMHENTAKTSPRQARGVWVSILRNHYRLELQATITETFS